MGDDGPGDRIKQVKKKGWRWCKCGTLFIILAIVGFVVGIALLVTFGDGLLDSYTGDDKSTRYGVSIFAIILLLIGFVMLLIAIGFCTCVYIIYRRMTKKPGGMHYDCPQYNYGQAPYPQQDWGDAPGPYGQSAPQAAPQGAPQGAQPPQGGAQGPDSGYAPSAPPPYSVDNAEIVPEIKPQVKAAPPEQP